MLVKMLCSISTLGSIYSIRNCNIQFPLSEESGILMLVMVYSTLLFVIFFKADSMNVWNSGYYRAFKMFNNYLPDIWFKPKPSRKQSYVIWETDSYASINNLVRWAKGHRLLFKRKCSCETVICEVLFADCLLFSGMVTFTICCDNVN